MRHVLSICLIFALSTLAITAAERPPVSPTMNWHGQMIPYPIQPPLIDYPEYTRPCVEKQYTITITNPDDLMFEVVAITLHEDSARPSAPDGWLGVIGTISEVPPHESRSVTLRLNVGGIVCSPNPTILFGRLVFTITQLGNTGEGVLPIRLTLADTIALPVWDSVTTQCGIPLTIGTNGNMGAHGIGGANLGFPQPSPECDTNGGTLNRGNADIYLADASPVIIKKNGSNYAASWAVFDDDITSPNGFKPLFPSSTRGSFSVPGQYDGYKTGTFCTSDSLVKLERTIFAPLNSADSCKFMIMRTRVFPYTIGLSVSNLAIGDVFDFDVPSDSTEFYNVGGTDPTRRLVYQRGFDSPDTVSDCYNNGLRYAGAALINMHRKNCTLDSAMYGGYNAANDSFVYPASGFVPEQLWANMQSTGYSNESRITDLHSVLTYKNGAANAGYTLPANDTLTIWTAVAVVRPTGGTVAQGLDSLKKEIDKAFKWLVRTGVITCICCPSFCIGRTGNVNMSVNETPDLSDLSLLIAYLIQTPRPTLPSFPEANINGIGEIDLSDLSMLIAYLTIEPRLTLPLCP